MNTVRISHNNQTGNAWFLHSTAVDSQFLTATFQPNVISTYQQLKNLIGASHYDNLLTPGENVLIALAGGFFPTDVDVTLREFNFPVAQSDEIIFPSNVTLDNCNITQSGKSDRNAGKGVVKFFHGNVKLFAHVIGMACGNDAKVTACNPHAIAVSTVSGAIANANAVGSLAQATEEGAIANANVDSAWAVALVMGAIANANVDNSGAFAAVAGAIANANAAGANACAEVIGAIANATVKYANALALAMGAIANANVADSRALAKVAGAIANANAAKAKAFALVNGAIANANAAFAIANAAASGAVANANAVCAKAVSEVCDAIANATVDNAYAIAAAKNAIANALVAGAWAIARLSGAIANSLVYGSIAAAEVDGAIANATVDGSAALQRVLGAIANISQQMRPHHQAVTLRLDALIDTWNLLTDNAEDKTLFHDYFLSTLRMWGTLEASLDPATFALKQITLLEQMNTDPEMRQACFALAVAGNAACHDNALAMFHKMQEIALEKSMGRPDVPLKTCIDYALALENQDRLLQLIHYTPQLVKGVGGSLGIDAFMALKLVCHEVNFALPVPVSSILYKRVAFETFRQPGIASSFVEIKLDITRLIKDKLPLKERPDAGFLALQPFWQTYLEHHCPEISNGIPEINAVAVSKQQVEEEALFEKDISSTRQIEIAGRMTAVENERKIAIAALYLEMTRQALE